MSDYPQQPYGGQQPPPGGNQPPPNPGQQGAHPQQTPPQAPSQSYGESGSYGQSGSYGDTQSYGSAPSYGDAQSYGGQPAYSGQQQPPPQQQPAPQPTTSGYGFPSNTAPAKKKATLGVVALVLSLIATIGFIVLAVLGGQAAAELAQFNGGQLPDENTPMRQDLAEKTLAMTGLFAAQAVPGILGLAGLICGIVSAATNRGRVFGIIAIVLAVISPIIAFFVFGSIVAPYAS